MLPSGESRNLVLVEMALRGGTCLCFVFCLLVSLLVIAVVVVLGLVAFDDVAVRCSVIVVVVDVRCCLL